MKFSFVVLLLLASTRAQQSSEGTDDPSKTTDTTNPDVTTEPTNSGEFTGNSEPSNSDETTDTTVISTSSGETTGPTNSGEITETTDSEPTNSGETTDTTVISTSSGETTEPTNSGENTETTGNSEPTNSGETTDNSVISTSSGETTEPTNSGEITSPTATSMEVTSDTESSTGGSDFSTTKSSGETSDLASTDVSDTSDSTLSGNNTPTEITTQENTVSVESTPSSVNSSPEVSSTITSPSPNVSTSTDASSSSTAGPVEPPVNRYDIQNPNDPDVKCIMAEFGARFIVTYQDKENMPQSVVITIPTSSAVRGTCDPSVMEISWTTVGSQGLSIGRRLLQATPANNQLKLEFQKDGRRRFVNKMSYVLQQDYFPNIKQDGAVLGSLEGALLESRVETSYTCSSETINFITLPVSLNNLDLELSNLKMESFNTKPGNDFSQALLCKADLPPPRNADFVGIAVGVSLAVLVIASVGAALIMRYRKRRKAATLELGDQVPIHYTRMSL